MSPKEGYGVNLLRALSIRLGVKCVPGGGAGGVGSKIAQFL